MSLRTVVEKIREDHGDASAVPEFDPNNGNDDAKFLFLFEAPGAKAVKTGYISFDNPDPSAKNFRQQLESAGIERREIAIWNTVPWYIGNKSRSSIRPAKHADIRSGMAYLEPIIEAMPKLRCIVLVGGAARSAHVFLSQVTEARILSCHHTSAKVINTNPAAAQENIRVFQFMKQSVAD